MIVQNSLTLGRAQLAPCGLAGLAACSGQCSGCPSRPRPAGGVGALSLDSLPAPFNDWRVLLALIAVVVFLGPMLLKMLRGRGGNSPERRRQLRIVRADYEAKAARVAA